MSWCDKLASTPAVGFVLDAHFASSATLIDSVASVLDGLMLDGKPQFNLNDANPLALTFTTLDGFQYTFEPTKTFVSFTYQMKVRPISGAPPIVEMTSQARPFTELLPEVCTKLIDATLLVPASERRTVVRVGVVSSSQVDLDEAPPGIRRFIDFVHRPWRGDLDAFAFQIISKLGSSARVSDRCIHTLRKSDDPDDLMHINLDFQRSFTDGHVINRDALQSVLDQAQKSALAYFEDLAEGNRFDEDIIRESAEL